MQNEVSIASTVYSLPIFTLHLVKVKVKVKVFQLRSIGWLQLVKCMCCIWSVIFDKLSPLKALDLESCVDEEVGLFGCLYWFG